MPVNNERSEPIQDIIERMPAKFGIWVSSIVLALVILLLVFGWIIDYPDTVTGSIVITAKYSPVKLIANSSGKLTLYDHKTSDLLKEGDYIAVIQNPANTNDIQKVKSLLANLEINKADYLQSFLKFPTKVSLGDVNIKYYTFLNSFQKVYDYEIGNLYQKQVDGLKLQIDQLNQLQRNNTRLKVTRGNNMFIYKKMSDRDSALLAEKVATEAEFDNSNISYLSSKENYESITNDINNTQQKISDDESKLKQLYIQDKDDKNKMHLDLLTAYDDLKDNIISWELRYVFKSPINGVLEFSKFWTDHQFIESGVQAFTIIPKENKIIGQVHLPAQGAGKVKVGQTVVIKLDNYPFEEYGSVKGKVASISSTTNILKTSNQNEVDTYLVEVDLPHALLTNYGSKLDFKYELKGSADIISNNRNLLERFFDNLKYSTKVK